MAMGRIVKGSSGAQVVGCGNLPQVTLATRGVTLVAMRGLVVLVLAVAGCGKDERACLKAECLYDLYRPRVDQAELPDLAPAADLAWGDLAGGIDIAEAPRDLTQLQDLTQLPVVDMAQAPDLLKIDMQHYPCADDGRLPLGFPCEYNSQCCNGLCWSGSGQRPYACCYANGTFCTASFQCCSGRCSTSGKQCY